MFAWIFRSRVVLPLVGASVAGCGWFGGGSPLESNDTLLRYVPADSPYVIAMVEAYPNDIADLYAEQAASVWELARAGIQSGLDEARRLQSENGAFGNPAETAALRELMEALADTTSAEGLQGLGLNRDSTFVFYGFGLLPVLRVTLAEGHDFAALLDRFDSVIRTAGGPGFATASIAGSEYRYLDADAARLIVMLGDDELAVTVAPASFGEAELQAVLGLELPAESIAASGRLKAIADTYGFEPQLISLIDIERLAETFLGAPNATDAALFELAGYDAQDLSATCRNEFLDLAGVMPAMVSGYTELSRRSMTLSWIVELRQDIAAGLATIPVAIPGLGAATDALMSFGMSFSIPAVRQFVAARNAALAADPFACEALQELSMAGPALGGYLNQPLLPVFDSLTGFSAAIDFGRFDPATSMPDLAETSISALIATTDAAGIIAMGSMFVPEIAALDLNNDGQIVELDLPGAFIDPAMNPFDSVYFAATDNAIGIGLGAEANVRLAELFDAPMGDASTFFSLSLDLEAYYAIFGDLLEIAPVLDPAGAPPEAFVAAMQDAMQAMQAIYTSETIDVRFTERGVEIPTRLEIAQ